MVRGVGHRDSTDITNVLAHGQRAVDAGLGDRAIGVVLRAQCLGARLELDAVFRRPPLALDAGEVGLAALVVEAVAHLVADHRADAAVVHCRVGVHVEERRLQDRRREHDFVELRVVVGVDRLRCHEPLTAVRHRAQARVLVVVVVLAHRHGVAEQVGRRDRHRAVVAPLLGVADLRIEGIELVVGLGLGRRAHPVDLVDVLAQRGTQVGDQLVHRGF